MCARCGCINQEEQEAELRGQEQDRQPVASEMCGRSQRRDWNHLVGEIE